MADSASESDSSSIDGGPIMMPPSPVTREQLQKRIESLQQQNRVLKVELETYKLRVKILQEENRNLREASVTIDPIRDYHVPIKEVIHWFDKFVVTKKPEDVSLLIKDLMLKYSKDLDRDLDILPVMSLPTYDGKLVQRDEEHKFMNDELEEDDMEEEEDGMPEDSEVSDSDNESSEQQMDDESPTTVTTPITNPIGINLNSAKRKEEQELVSVKSSDPFIEETISDQFLKPDMSEIGNSSNRDTLSYLKSKRIVRHKNVSTIDTKRFKLSDD